CPDVLPPILPTESPHNVKKNRYISADVRGEGAINPSNLHVKFTLTASLVNGLTGVGVGSEWWANAPDANCISLVGPEQPKDIPNWSGCDIVHFTGCGIIPTSTYDVIVIYSTSTPSAGALSADTQALPVDNKWWGDAAGFFNGTEWTDPQGTTNFDDVTAALKTFQDPNAINATHTSITDIHPNRPTLLPPANQINKLVNTDDMFNFIQAFQGFEYPGPEIDLCP
ncbi:MAG: hypothetical protein IIB57_13300, partial [Planctomycetes bacterium]|nr:hypothetical protein [Planctomycetota bacterium]